MPSFLYYIYVIILLYIMKIYNMVKKMKKKQKGKYYTFQKSLNVESLLMHVRLQRDVRVTNNVVQKVNNATSNFEEYNVKNIYGSAQFNSSSSYILYKVDVTNYGNEKTGILGVENPVSGTNYSLCDSNGSNCTTDFRTPICDGNNCTLGATKSIYVKANKSTSGSTELLLNFNFQPYNDITYTYFNESTNSFPIEVMSQDTFTITLTSKPEEVAITGTAAFTYNSTTGVLTVSNVGSDLTIQAKYLATQISEEFNKEWQLWQEQQYRCGFRIPKAYIQGIQEACLQVS